MQSELDKHLTGQVFVVGQMNNDDSYNKNNSVKTLGYMHSALDRWQMSNEFGPFTSNAKVWRSVVAEHI